MGSSSDQELHFLDEKTLKSLKALMDLLELSSLSSIRYEHENQDVRYCIELCKETKTHTVASSMHSAPTSPPQNVIASAVPVLQVNSETSSLHWVRSPLVGTAYVSPKPSAPAFIKIGDRVETGAPLLIVEAMKVMNIIKSPVSGYIREIRFSDSCPVEYDELLVGIDTNG